MNTLNRVWQSNFPAPLDDLILADKQPLLTCKVAYSIPILLFGNWAKQTITISIHEQFVSLSMLCAYFIDTFIGNLRSMKLVSDIFNACAYFIDTFIENLRRMKLVSVCDIFNACAYVKL